MNALPREEVDAAYQGVGKAAYDPMVLLKMVLYQMLLGNHSPATWYAEAKRNKCMQWLGRGYQPSRRTWYDFRDRTWKFIEQTHQQMIRQAIDEGHVDPSTGTLDGSSMAACASRHRMVNQETLEKRQAILEEALEEVERVEDAPRWMPKSEAGRRDLLDRMQRAEEILEQRLAQNAARPAGKRKAPNKVVVSLSDPDAPLGLDKRKTYRPLYTVQRMVEPFSGLTMAYECEATTNDSGMLAPMIDKTQQIVRGQLKRVLADGSYCSILDVIDAKARNIDLIAPVSASGGKRVSKSRTGEEQIPREAFHYDPQSNSYTCPEGQVLAYKDREKKARGDGRVLFQSRYQTDAAICQHCPLADQCLAGQGPRTIKRTEGEEHLEAQREKMATDQAKSLYKLRGQTVELAFADAKQNRNHDRFHGRGLARVRAETGLAILAQNILKLDKLQRNAVNPEKLAG